MINDTDPQRPVHLPASSPLGRALRSAPTESTAETVSEPLPLDTPQPPPPPAPPEPIAEAPSEPAVAPPVKGIPLGPPASIPTIGNVQLDDDELAAALGNVSIDKLMGDKSTLRGELELDSRCQATVVKMDHDSVFLALGSQHEGIVPLRQFATPPAIGDTFEVVVARFLPDEGLYEVTIPGAAVSVADWSDLEEGVTVEARVTGQNAGGLECEVNNIRGFIPISLVSPYRVENLEEYVGQKLTCIVTEANPQRRNLVLSHRAFLEREKEAAMANLWAELAVGQVREGIVRNVRDFGAFVDLGGVDGLIHVSQLSWDRIQHPSDVVQVGQKVRVRIEKIDPATRKISLAYRDLLDNPWDRLASEFPIGAVVPGTVTKVMDFGAFVRIAPGIEGLVHISELDHRRVARVGQVVSEGDAVQVKVLSIQPESQRISLSIKQARQPAADAEDAAEADDSSTDAADTRSSATAPSRSNQQLKGGTNRRSGGEKFGLNW